MVSIRKQYSLWQLRTANISSTTPPPQIPVNETDDVNPFPSSTSVSEHSLPSDDASLPQEEQDAKNEPALRNISVSIALEECPFQSSPGKPVVRQRKNYKRKRNQEQPCELKGVYFKNMKWQAAIKVDKKQIHLGTLSSKIDAARLYDRAAFLCGRSTNFDLSEEDKGELSKFNWDEFVAITRSKINHKKGRRRTREVSDKKPEPTLQNVDLDLKPEQVTG